MKKHLLVTLFILGFFLPSILFAQSIALGGRHSLAVCLDNTVDSWGYNGYGQLGNGNIMEQNTPTTITGLSGVTNIAGGLFHFLFLKSDVTVWSCGRNSPGNLGDGTNTDRYLPVQVLGLSNIVQVAGGGEHSLFVKSDGTVWACGLNSSRQLGDGTTISRTNVVQVIGLTEVIQAAAGAEFSLFLKNDGTVWACGHNGYGQYGNGTNITSTSPVQISGLTNVRQLSAGEWHSLFVKNDGTVWASGRNQYGQLGDGTIINKNAFFQINTLNGIMQADGGGIHSVFVKNNGTAWACGLNSSGFAGDNNGQLGDGTTVDKLTPVQVISNWGSETIIHAEATREHSLFLTANGSVWGCGRNNYGQLGNGVFAPINSTSPVTSNSSTCTTPTNAINKFDNDDLKVTIFPNPFSTQTVLQTDNLLKNATLTVLNCFGQTVKQIKNISGQTVVLSRDNLASGLFFIRLTENNRTLAVNKLVITDN